jgi:hypothetical protein
VIPNELRTNATAISAAGQQRSVTIRVIAFSVAGTLGVLRGLIGYLHPTYWAPTTLLDWTSVITYTCFLIAAAVSLVILAAEQRALSRWPITAAAAGAAAAGAANALEDGFGVSRFGYPFAAGIAVMASGLLLGGAALTLSRSGPGSSPGKGHDPGLVPGVSAGKGLRPPRHLGPLLIANVAALALAFDDLGLILFGSTWLLTAAAGSRRAIPCACR